MKFEKFEDMEVWKRAKDIAVQMYHIYAECKDLSFKNQIQRAAVSISNNIAEGFERQSNKEFKHFLFISKGSAGEVRSMIHISKDLKFINEELYIKLLEDVIIISKMLSSLIKKL